MTHVPLTRRNMKFLSKRTCYSENELEILFQLDRRQHRESYFMIRIEKR